jgi:hypothetical protein
MIRILVLAGLYLLLIAAFLSWPCPSCKTPVVIEGERPGPTSGIPVVEEAGPNQGYKRGFQLNWSSEADTMVEVEQRYDDMIEITIGKDAQVTIIDRREKPKKEPTAQRPTLNPNTLPAYGDSKE